MWTSDESKKTDTYPQAPNPNIRKDSLSGQNGRRKSRWEIGVSKIMVLGICKSKKKKKRQEKKIVQVAN